MRRSTFPRTLALTLSCALSLAGAVRMLRADDAPPAEPKPPAEAPPSEAAPADEASIVQHQPEPEMIEEVKLIKVDAEGKTVTILVPPKKDTSQRAYKRMKLSLDDHSLIMIDQQPSTVVALQEGMLVNVTHMKKGKNDVVDTIVVLKAAEPK